jgi:outer membrane protein OmpA-like peptidoglycan-associated protein
VLTYSNILILATSVVLAGNLSLKRSHVVCSPAAHGFQVALLKITTSPTVASSRVFLSEQEPDSRVERSNGSDSIAPSAAVSIVDPPFLRHPVFFDPNSLEPSVVGRNMLQRAAIWLREHRETRVLIVGSCDSSGSETCTHALAEGRGAAIQRLLRSFGIGSNQVVGVKGWDNLDHSCRPAEIRCQQLSRSVRIFMAGSATPEEKP